MDRLELYRWAVQDPETHVEVLRRIYERVRSGSVPRLLREDFAGTSAEAIAWVGAGEGREAVAVDLDGGVLAWARERAVRLLGERAGAIEWFVGDALVVEPEKGRADLLCVLNYSVLYMHELAKLDEYLRRTRAGLAARGVLVMNLFGGAAATRVGEIRHEVTPHPRSPAEQPGVGKFGYVWEVRSFDRRSARIECRIHFEVPDGPGGSGAEIVRDAFVYDWRLWSPGELMAACTRAGFRTVQLWRHTFDPAKGDLAGGGVYLGPVRPQSLDGDGSWNAYVVAGV